MIGYYTIKTADNGWIVSWWGDEEEPDFHNVVFEIPESHNMDREDPQALMDLLYFIKETVCGVYHSKHKATNCMVRMEREVPEGE